MGHRFKQTVEALQIALRWMFFAKSTQLVLLSGLFKTEVLSACHLAGPLLSPVYNVSQSVDLHAEHIQ